MTVKCLTKDYQDNLVVLFVERGESIDDLAVLANRSRRTIIRILEDHGIDPGIKRRPGARKPKQPIPNEAQATMDYVDEPIGNIDRSLYEIHNRQNIAQPQLSFIRRLFNRITTGLSLR